MDWASESAMLNPDLTVLFRDPTLAVALQADRDGFWRDASLAKLFLAQEVLAYRHPDMKDAGHILSIGFTDDHHAAPAIQYTRRG